MPTDVTGSPVNLPAKRRRSIQPSEVLANAKRATKAKRSVGRPLLYHPDLCNRAMLLAKQGKSMAVIAAAFNVDRATLYKWAADYPDFSTALARAKAYEQEWWENTGQKKLGAKHFQAQVWRTSMSARFKDDYTEARNVDVTVSLEGIVSALQQREAPKVVEGQATLKDDAHTQAQDVVGPNGRIDKATD